MKNYILRDSDVVNGTNDLEHLYTFNNFPVFMGCVEHDLKDDLLEDMSWHISKSSGLVQLNPLLPLDVVYFTEHGSGTVGKLWNEHHLSFSKFIKKYNPNTILEIGGLHGILAKNYLTLDESINWTMIEPNPRVDPSIPINVIEGFFDENFRSELQYDAVVHSHVLEHIYDPKVFFNHLSTFIDEGKLLIFSVPNMQEMINRKYVNCINFEHTFLLTEIYIDYFLKIMGFELIEKEYFKEDHSVFYAARKKGLSEHINSPNVELSNQYELNKKVFNDYINFHLEDVVKINNVISSIGKPIFLFGAHVFAQYLISFGLKTENVLFILDNDLKKSDKRLYGTNLISKSPKILSDYDTPVVILRAGVYNEEIKTDILNNINSNTIFI